MKGMRTRIHLLLALFTLAACGSETSPTEPLRLTSTQPPPAYIGEAYQAEFPAAGGVRPYRYTLEGQLPKGLEFRDGRISGTPQEKGTFAFTLVLEDAALSSRAFRLELTVTDPPPPRFELVLPNAQVEGPFVWVVRVKDRPTTAFRARFTLKGLTPILETLAVHPDLLYVLRWDATQQVLDLDAAFTRPQTDVEVFRVTLEAPAPLRPNAPHQVQFFDAGRAPYTPKAPARSRVEGTYGFETLLELAQNWGKTRAADADPNAPLAGDLNGDGKVNTEDLERLRSSYAWGSSPQGSSPTAR